MKCNLMHSPEPADEWEGIFANILASSLLSWIVKVESDSLWAVEGLTSAKYTK